MDSWYGMIYTVDEDERSGKQQQKHVRKRREMNDEYRKANLPQK